jgi:hypothetical protein
MKENASDQNPEKNVTVIEPKRSLIVDKEKYHQQRLQLTAGFHRQRRTAYFLYYAKESLLGDDRRRKVWSSLAYMLTRASQHSGNKRPQFKKMIND